MRSRTYLFVCVAFLIVCGVGLTQSFDTQFTEGKKALDAGKFNKAYNIFSALFKEQPDNEKVNSAMGQAAFGCGKLSHAAMAYERILAQNPENDWAREFTECLWRINPSTIRAPP